MPEKYEGLLDHGRVEEVALDSKSWMPVRASRWSLDLVRPAFLTPRRMSLPTTPNRRTAWLDGLRGFAAFIVYWHHQQLWAHYADGMNRVYENGFGYEGKHYFVSLPFFRNFFSGGHFAVAVFFIISGYVLSAKSLSLIQKGEFLKTGDSIGSALFRRWLRLYLPVMGVTFLWVAQWHTTRIWTAYGEPKATFREELWDWYAEFKNYSFVFNGGDFYRFSKLYHGHIWSIPIEFRGSIVVYTACSALSRCSKKARLWCETGLIVYFMWIVDGWYGASFIAGMLLCDLDLLAQSDELPPIFTKLEPYKELIFFHLFVVSLYLGGCPSYVADVGILRETPGWVWLSYLKPQAVLDHKWFYLFWASLFLVASVPRLPVLKAFFETRFCLYLGRISFALYLVHGPVIWMLGDRLYAATGGWTRPTHQDHIPGWINAFRLSRDQPMGFEIAFLAPQIILLPVTFWAAELVTKLLDEPSLRFSAWLYKKTLTPPHMKD